MYMLAENKSRYFFGDQSSVGCKVKVEVKGSRGSRSRKEEGIIIFDSSEMVVIRYFKKGWRESFIRSDLADGTVKLKLMKKKVS